MRRVAGASAALVLLAIASRTDAAPRAPRGPSVAALAGYALEVGTAATGGLDAYRFGLGARAGTTLPCRVYVGGSFVVHFGSEVLAEGPGGSTYEAREHAAYGGGEIGYDLALGRVLLRPYVGLGLLGVVEHTTVRSASAGRRDAYLYVAPGATAAYRVGAWFAGVDLRAAIAPAEAPTAWAPALMLVAGASLPNP